MQWFHRRPPSHVALAAFTPPVNLSCRYSSHCVKVGHSISGWNRWWKRSVRDGNIARRDRPDITVKVVCTVWQKFMFRKHVHVRLSFMFTCSKHWSWKLFFLPSRGLQFKICLTHKIKKKSSISKFLLFSTLRGTFLITANSYQPVLVSVCTILIAKQ